MKRLALILMMLVPVGALADAPETATVSGTIVDPGGSPLPGVSVTLSSGRGDKFAITDANGQYRFVGVVPDTYELKAELEGLGEAQANFHAAAGDRKAVDLTLQAAVEGGVVDVTAETPMVDKFNVTAGSTVTSEIGEQTAGTTRTYYGVINALPGVTADAENDDIQQTRPSVNGTHFADQGVYVDGVDTTFAKFGGSRVFLPTTALTEVSMEAGGSSAEYGRYIGSSTNVIVKSGTNRWHADVLWNHQRVDWSADYKDQPSLAERRNRPYPVDWFRRCHGDDRDQGRGQIPPSIVEEVSTINRDACLPGSDEWAGSSDGYEFSMGGPLRRDKFWFFLGASEFDDAYSERLLGGDPYDVSLSPTPASSS
ncbi:MAG: carboxypeptidase-like regulatory domain-containing protein [Acidobacteriota bacterium]|nr:carboxypeptidase-like regulatory domain-containing protein [Acidobacteriota bacterium]MDE3266243.1 carboxypeptidase-like regulatory domain-containing protein [Acidobacteriota bacterium]